MHVCECVCVCVVNVKWKYADIPFANIIYNIIELTSGIQTFNLMYNLNPMKVLWGRYLKVYMLSYIELLFSEVIVKIFKILLSGHKFSVS